MLKARYVKPFPYMGNKKVCFECLQNGHAQQQIVVLQNHRGFLCEDCAKVSASREVANGLRAYQLVKLIDQPWIGDLADEIMRIADTGYSGKVIEWFYILRERDRYNHLLLRSVRLALEVLTDEGHLSESYEVSIEPTYFCPDPQNKKK